LPTIEECVDGVDEFVLGVGGPPCHDLVSPEVVGQKGGDVLNVGSIGDPLRKYGDALGEDID